MAVRLESTTKRFIGNSTDEKPLVDVPSGSRFLEINTGIVFIFNGTSWISSIASSDTSSVASTENYGFYFEAIIDLLTDIRDILSS